MEILIKEYLYKFVLDTGSLKTLRVSLCFLKELIVSRSEFIILDFKSDKIKNTKFWNCLSLNGSSLNDFNLLNFSSMDVPLMLILR